MSKTLSFTHGKLTGLRFEAEKVNYEAQGGSFFITAEGVITLQDTPSVEAMFQGFSCHFDVSENGVSLLSGRYEITLLLLEQDQLAACIRPQG